jgi:NodT family efflux transporter outer membrane factor (OMF) lipoprotein
VKKTLVLAVMTLFLTCGCFTVGPNYKKKEPPVPSRFTSLEHGVSRGDDIPKGFLDSWWSIFKDPILESLMNRVASQNLDLRIARARVQQARAQSAIASSNLFPEGSLIGDYRRVRRTETTVLGAAASSAEGREQDIYLAGFDASWEIDIFGAIRRGVEAANAELDASVDGLRDVLVTLRGEIGRNYMELRGLELRINIARQEVKIRSENVEITVARAKAGLVSELDAARARGELANAEARIPALERSLKAAIHRLAVLVGEEPTALEPHLLSGSQLPATPPDLPVGLPSDLLRRRPDIRKTERELAAATARIGVATADLFPRFSLTGSFGYEAYNSNLLFQDQSNFWGVGPTLRWPILNFKRLLAQIDSSKAIREETLARYERSVLLALEEVENALVAISREKNRVKFLDEAVLANDLAVKLAMERYLAGVQSYLAVIDAQAALYAAEDQVAQSRQAQVLALVALYKALGGGWQSEEEHEKTDQ